MTGSIEPMQRAVPTVRRHSITVQLFVGDTSIVALCPYSPEAISIFRKHGLRWSSVTRKWRRLIAEKTVDARDIAEELGWCLLSEGFAIESTSIRVIETATSGQYGLITATVDRFGAIYKRDEELYEKLKRIDGACWSKELQRLTFPMTSWDEVEDAALALSFGFTQKAKELIMKIKADIGIEEKTFEKDENGLLLDLID